MNRSLFTIGTTALAILASTASATTVGHLSSGSQLNASDNLSFIIDNNLITSVEADSYSSLTNSDFNALSPSDLAGLYDVLVLPWRVNASADMDWETRLLPYLNAGGSVLWEDPNNIAEISGLGRSGVELTSSSSYGSGVGPTVSGISAYGSK